MPEPAPAPVAPNRRRRWLRLGVRGAMGFVLILAVGLGYVVHLAHVQREAVAAIERTGGKCLYDWDVPLPGRTNAWGAPDAPPWLVAWLGRDYFGHVAAVTLGKEATDAELAHVGRLDRLRKLTFPLGGGRMTDAGAAHLAGLARLEQVSLAGPGVTGAALMHLVGATELESLSLHEVAVRAEHLVALAPHRGRLMNLSFHKTGLDDAGMAHLAGMERLGLLLISDEPITGAGLRHLVACPPLKSLILERTRVADLAALPPLVDLRYLKLTDSPVTDAGLAPVARMASLEHLYLMGTALTDAGLVHLGNLPRLINLGLERTRVGDGDGLHWLNSDRNLGHVGLTATALTERGLAAFRPTRTMGLHLVGLPVTDAGLAALAGQPWVAGLDLGAAPITDAGLAHLATLPNLARLHLVGAPITDAGLAYLAASPRLADLDLGLTPVTDAGLAHLAALKTLRHLGTAKTRVTDAGRATLRRALPGVQID